MAEQGARGQPFIFLHILLANASVREEEADITFQCKELEDSIGQDRSTGRVEDSGCFPNVTGGEVILTIPGFL